MKSFLLAGVSATIMSLIAGGAMAADMPVKAEVKHVDYYGWTGIYGGIQAGVAWTSLNANNNNNTLGFPLFSEDFRSNGKGYGGGQIGAQVQVSMLVLGVDLSLIRASGLGASVPGFFSPATSIDAAYVRQIGMLTGRLGIATDSWLFYAKAGGAESRTSWARYSNVPGSFYEEPRPTNRGYVFGGGIEYRLHKNWTVGIDYTYVKLNEATDTAPIIAGGVVTGSYQASTSGNVQMIGIRLNALLDWPTAIVAKY
jgi:outer membrane immunogenic protein